MRSESIVCRMYVTKTQDVRRTVFVDSKRGGNITILRMGLKKATPQRPHHKIPGDRLQRVQYAELPKLCRISKPCKNVH